MTTQSKTITLITALIIAILFVVTSVDFAAANTNDTGFVTGITWFDSNENDMREPTETVAPNTAVYLRLVDANAAVAGGMVVFSDANGIFDFGSVAFGTYEVQAENGDTVEITLSEVNSAISVEIAVNDPITSPVVQGYLVHQIFLPLVIR